MSTFVFDSMNANAPKFLIFLLVFTFSFCVKCDDKKKGTHVRAEERVEPVNLSLDSFMEENSVAFPDGYESLSDYPIWEDVVETYILDQKLGDETSEFQDEVGKGVRNGLKELAINTAQAYNDVIAQSKVDDSKNENLVSELYSSGKYFVNGDNVLNGLNKTRNAFILGESIAGIGENDRNIIRMAFPEVS
ncbi:hypothetical protein RS030_91558 [Cryptosporidium xiaoi]|uniref:Uncharacterized protein n=1 Tax=Cryptosporidium xiaoi TaxID=659607 RepID=A0AAV9XTH7_9CRYT